MLHEQKLVCAPIGRARALCNPAGFACRWSFGRIDDRLLGKPGHPGAGQVAFHQGDAIARDRYHPSLASETVQSWNLQAVAWDAQLRRRAKTGGVRAVIWVTAMWAGASRERMVRSLRAQRGLPDNSVFFGYDTCSLEVMEHLKERNVACIVDQIDPCRVEVELVQAEQRVWPGWEEQSLSVRTSFLGDIQGMGGCRQGGGEFGMES